MKRGRRGMTLVEVLVVLSIISLLMALVLPAVGRVRAAALRIQCGSNLRQLAQAAHAYHDTHGMLPGWIYFAPRGTYNSLASVHSMLLPHLGQSEVYDALNFEVRVTRPPMLPSLPPEHLTVARTRISVFLCPADGATGLWQAPANYRGCIGPGTNTRQDAEFIDGNHGMFSARGGVGISFAHAIDGLQHTALFSERLVGDRVADASANRERTILVAWTSIIRDADRARRACRALGQFATTTRMGDAGRYWLISGIDHTLYSHGQPPNSPIPDCQESVVIPPRGLSTARAHHDGIVNVALADASVRPVSAGVDVAVWRALATRDGGETVLNSSF